VKKGKNENKLWRLLNQKVNFLYFFFFFFSFFIFFFFFVAERL